MTLTTRDLIAALVGAVLVLSGLVWLLLAVVAGLALGTALAASMTVERAGELGRKLRTALGGRVVELDAEPEAKPKRRQRSNAGREPRALRLVK